MILTHLVLFEFFTGAGGEVATTEDAAPKKHIVFGLGNMGKSRVHPHPLFSRHKQ